MVCTIISSGIEFEAKKYNEFEEPIVTIKEKLRNAIWHLYCKGYNVFYLNCEYGIPLWSAEIITALKLYNDISLRLVIPYEEQTTDWYEDIRDRYFTVHEKADTIEFASSQYSEDCYELCSEIMIEQSDLLLVFGECKASEDYAKNSNCRVLKLPLF